MTIIPMDPVRINTGNAEIIIVRIKDYAQYEQLITDRDREYLSQVASGARRAAGAAWRAVVRAELGDVDIQYEEAGAPVITAPETGRFIGISHSQKWAAVIISGSRCAVDIEERGRNFERVARRYISPEEAALPESGNELFRAALWCAKEPLYKISGCRGLDLVGDLRVTSTDLAGGKLDGAIRVEAGAWRPYHMEMFPHEECLLVWAVE